MESSQLGSDRDRLGSELFGRNRGDYVISQQYLAALVGAVAFLLPIVLYLATKLGVCFYDSISHFYYAQFWGDIFVGSLVFIGTFLMAYRGEYEPDDKWAKIAGLCAYAVALFPTKGAGCDMERFSGRILADLQIVTSTGTIEVVRPDNSDRFFELFKNAELLHYASGALLFLFLAYYCFFVFTRIVPEQHIRPDGTALTWHKAIRNSIYRVSGNVIVLCLIVLISNPIHTYLTGNEWSWWNRYNYTFWLESLILWAFGISWITKGRFFGMLLLDPRDRERSLAAVP
jgi:hypothetical protein